LQSSAARPRNTTHLEASTIRLEDYNVLDEQTACCRDDVGVRVFKLVPFSSWSMSLAPILGTLLGRPRDSGCF
jgi:hypothetical protein